MPGQRPGPVCGTKDDCDLGTLALLESPCPGSLCALRSADIEAKAIAAGSHTIAPSLVPLRVIFREDESEVYGFDDLTHPEVPCKSVEIGKSDTIQAQIIPANTFANVQFTSSAPAKVQVVPAVAKSGLQVVTVTGVDAGESEIKASCGGRDLGEIKVKTYAKRIRTVAVRLVHEKNYNSTDVPDADIKAMLNAVYIQGVVEFKLTRLPAKTVEFDKDKDRQLDTKGPWMTAEMKAVVDACKDDNYDFNLFLVDKSNDPKCGGQAMFAQRYAFVHADVCSNPPKTIAHELGHAQGLQHYRHEDDEEALMYPTSAGGQRLREFDWVALHAV
jgi:hypothetical protein